MYDKMKNKFFDFGLRNGLETNPIQNSGGGYENILDKFIGFFHINVGQPAPGGGGTLPLWGRGIHDRSGEISCIGFEIWFEKYSVAHLDEKRKKMDNKFEYKTKTIFNLV